MKRDVKLGRMTGLWAVMAVLAGCGEPVGCVGTGDGLFGLRCAEHTLQDDNTPLPNSGNCDKW